MVMISVFLTIIVANLGGFLDKVVSADIEESIGCMIQGGWLRDVTDKAERNQIIEQTRAAMHESCRPEFPLPGALLQVAVERPDPRLGGRPVILHL